MKNKILFFVFIAAGALLLSINNSYSRPSYCPDPGDGSCSDCHSTPGTGNIAACPSACNDSDGDGYGNPGDASCRNGRQLDCNDRNAAINPGAVEDCTDNVDNDCNGLVDTLDPNAFNCPVECIDNDGDNYATNGGSCGQIDCNDTRTDINPGAFEVCDDGIDNDCDNRTDCDDSACTGDPACLAASCADYGNDRAGCSADPRCYFSGKEKSCFEIPAEQLDCEESGGRWNKKKGSCR